MTKSETLVALAESTGKTKKEVVEMLEAIVALAYKETKKSGEFTLPGLGKLKKKHRDARMGRNPQTGKAIKIPAGWAPKFRAGAEFKHLVK